MHFIINQNPPFEELYVTYEIAKWNFISEGFMNFKPKILPFDYYVRLHKRPNFVVIIMVYEPFTRVHKTQLLSMPVISFIDFY